MTLSMSRGPLLAALLLAAGLHGASCLEVREAADVDAVHMGLRGADAPRSLWMPSLVQLIILGSLLGGALCAAALLLGQSDRKGAGLASGCCGGTLLLLAAGLLAAKIALSRVAGPAPAGPIAEGPLRSQMQVENVIVPFSVSQLNLPGPIHDLYKQGMQNAMDKLLPKERRGSVVVADVQARGVEGYVPGPLAQGCADDPPDWRSGNSTCQDYAAQQWCAADGGRGTGWSEAWGAFEEDAPSGSTAAHACCNCGGGYRGNTSSSLVVLHFTMLTTKDNTTNGSTEDASTPELHLGMLNFEMQKAADNLRKTARVAKGLSVPGWLNDLAHGHIIGISQFDPSLPPLPPGTVVKRQPDTFGSSVEARIRCVARHNLNSDLQEAGRAALKQKTELVVKYLEGVIAEGSWLKLRVTDRCNDPAQAEAMRVCISDQTAWADLVSVGPVVVPSHERSTQRYLCKVACGVQKAASEHKSDVVRGINEKVSGFSLDDNSIGVDCAPSTHQCPDCSTFAGVR